MRLNSCVLPTLLCVSVLTSVAPILAADATFATLESFEEQINSEVNVSGHVVVGLMGVSAFQGIQQKTLAISALSLKQGDSLCLNVNSRDGVYSLNGQYIVDDNPEQLLMLGYPTNEPDIVESFKQDTVALTARVGSCQNSVLHYLLPQLAETDPKEALLAVNGFEATDVFYSVTSASGDTVNGECFYIEEGRHTAYDYSCKIPLASDSASFELRIERELYGRELPAVDIRLLR